MTSRRLAAMRVLANRQTLNDEVVNDIRKNKDVVFGNQALNRRVPGFLGVETRDFDILTRGNPTARAAQIERRLDRKFGGDVFFTKAAQKPGTRKVQFVGPDLRKNTRDDVTIVDVSKLKRGVMFTRTNGLNVITRQQIRKDRLRAIRNPQAKFRREKDRRALDILRQRNRLRRLRLI